MVIALHFVLIHYHCLLVIRCAGIKENNKFLWLSQGIYSCTWTQEATVALGYASSNSYASFVLFKLPTCFISRYTYSWRMNQLTVNCFSFHITYSIPAQNFCLFQKCQRSVSQDVGSRIKPVSRLLRLKWIKIKLDLTCLKSEFRRLISTIYTRQY